MVTCRFLPGVGVWGAGVGDGAGEPVELGDDQGVPGADGGERLVQAGPGPRGAGQALVGPLVVSSEKTTIQSGCGYQLLVAACGSAR